jgi:DNA helicase-4
MSGYEKKERFLLYSFFPILFIGFILGISFISSTFYLPLFLIFSATTAVGFLIIKYLFGFETINQDLNPSIIQRRRKEEKLAQLEIKKEALLQELQEKTDNLDELITYVSNKFDRKKEIVLQAVHEFNYLKNRDNYFSKLVYHNWYVKWSHLGSIVNLFHSLDEIPISYESEMAELTSFLNKNTSIVFLRNQIYVKQELEKFEDYFNTLEKYPLTLKQREAIITDEHRNLVIAGAGTGKTSTLIGKTGYLIQKKVVKPDELLLLSFGRDPKNEMITRLKDRLGISLDVNTFHGLGMKIIAEARNEKPSISNLSTDNIKLQQFIGKIIESNLEDKDFLINLNRFFLSQIEYKSLWEFKTQGEYYTYLRENKIRSLNGDIVKSFEELEIANWLFQNGIKYEYEKKYKHKTSNKLYGQYKPDFYLNDYDIYLEHFGIDREGNTALCVPKAKYLQERTWKLETHQRFGTKLIETYSYEKKEGNLTEKLLEKLLDHEVELTPVSQDQIFKKINEMGIVKPIYGLLTTFLNLYKSSTTDIHSLRERAKESDDINRNLSFVEIFDKIEKSYEKYLAEHYEIDFNDMIKKATQVLLAGEVQTDYKYVLIDEFQDISQSRNQLLSAIVNQNPECKLFCVGDDWQSIYRFTGSDLSIMTHFEDYYTYSTSLFLDETFRFNNQLCEISSKFIQQNKKQIPKKLKSRISSEKPAVTLVHTDNVNEELTKTLSVLNEQKGSVFILGRYNRENPNLRKYYENLIVDFHTIHKSKGTQADFVIICMQGGKMGFPCQIVDDPVLNLVLSKQDSHPNSEERRLFYVAITRAKKHVYLISNNNNPSEFITELSNGEYFIEKGITPESVTPKCPRCSSGELVTRDTQYGKFYACSNYPYCEYIAPKCPVCISGYMVKKGTIYRCTECNQKSPACPECKEGVRVLKNGRYGIFYGCTNYPDCKYTYSPRNKRREPFNMS